MANPSFSSTGLGIDPDFIRYGQALRSSQMSNIHTQNRVVEILQAALAGVLMPRRDGGAKASRGPPTRFGSLAAGDRPLLRMRSAGSLPKDAFVHVAAAIVTAMIGFCAAFRSGLNRAAADPSLTMHQMVVATAIVMYAMYFVGRGRSGRFPNIVLMIFLFGVLRLRTRALLRFALFILIAHAATTALRLYLHTRCRT